MARAVRAPILTIASGDSVRFSIPNSGWLLESGEKFIPRDPAVNTGHALVGPIAVRGAKADQTLVVHVDEVRPGSWGVTNTKPPHFIRWKIDGDTATSLGRTIRLAPFLGVLGMPPREPGIHSTIPPRRFGGNIDCKDLVTGTTLYLPISVDGALFSAGDGHAAQGDGEVSGTAIESPVDAQVTLSGLPSADLLALDPSLSVVADTLASTTGSVFAGAPRNIVGGMRLSF